MAKLKQGVGLFILGLLVCMTTAQTSIAQNGANVVNSDFESWISAGLRLKVHKKWSFELSESLRLNENSTHIQQYFTNLSIGYQPLKFLEFGAALRFAQKK